MEIDAPYVAPVVDNLSVVTVDGYDVIVVQTHSHCSVAVVIVVVVAVDVVAVVAEVKSNNEIEIRYDLKSTDYEIYKFSTIKNFLH